MKCSDAQKKIYLYQELAQEERTAVDSHCEQCPACRALYASLAVQREQLRDLPRPSLSGREREMLTDRIMQAIVSPVVPPARRKNGVLQNLFQVWRQGDVVYSLARYAMIAVSVSMIGFFAYEQAAESPVYTVRQTRPAVETTETQVFHSDAFYNVYKNNRHKEKPGERIIEFLYCLKQCLTRDGRGDCVTCKAMYPKLYKKYENN